MRTLGATLQAINESLTWQSRYRVELWDIELSENVSPRLYRSLSRHSSAFPFARACVAVLTLLLVGFTALTLPAHGFTSSSAIVWRARASQSVLLRSGPDFQVPVSSPADAATRPGPRRHPAWRPPGATIAPAPESRYPPWRHAGQSACAPQQFTSCGQTARSHPPQPHHRAAALGWPLVIVAVIGMSTPSFSLSLSFLFWG